MNRVDMSITVLNLYLYFTLFLRSFIRLFLNIIHLIVSIFPPRRRYLQVRLHHGRHQRSGLSNLLRVAGLHCMAADCDPQV